MTKELTEEAEQNLKQLTPCIFDFVMELDTRSIAYCEMQNPRNF
jgi:hypothetical protein